MMTRQYRLSSPAEQDIAAILEYIAKRNLDAALALVDRFTELFELIAAQPELGEQFGDPDVKCGALLWAIMWLSISFCRKKL
jgi:plasmid stabilization system protein ParE